jgi:ligand-binding sensor domain-containing protein/AraC-like DNA-binding protein
VKRLYSLVIVFLVLITNASGQSYDFRHYQVEQGLSYNTVYSILQDSRGFMWFATKDGLNRFDGYNFKIFRNDPSDRNSIGSNLILCLFEDASRTLWVGTSKGLYQYNDSLQRFKLISFTRNKYIIDIKGDAKGNIYLLLDGQVFRYNQHNNSSERFPAKQDFRVSSMLFDDQQRLWLCTSEGYLKQYVPDGKSFNSYNLFGHSKSVTSNWIDRIYLTKNNSILVGTSHQGVKLFDLTTLDYKDILTSNADSTAVFAKNFMHYEGDTYWFATESGVFVYNLKTGSYTQLKKDPNNPYAISDNAVYNFAKDKEGGVWVGTYFGGLNYYPKPFTSFEKYFHGSRQYPISGNAVREITADTYGNLWVATEDAGLNQLRKNGQVDLFKPGAGTRSIAHTNIHGLLASNDELWVGTFEQGLDVIDIPSSKVIRHYDKGNGLNDLKSNFVESIFQTSNGIIILGTSNGIFQYNRSSDNFSPLEGFPKDNHYMSIKEDATHTIWAGTIGNGLHYYNPETGKGGTYRIKQGEKGSISDNFINSLFIDQNKRLWVLTENGLNLFDEKTKTFRTYSSKDGFPSNVFYRMQQDEKGLLWISTARGLVSFNPSEVNKSFTIYGKANGLLSDQFNYNSSYVDANEKLFFGSVKGMIAFNPGSFLKNEMRPQVYITGFQVFNKELTIDGKHLTKSIFYTDHLNLDYDQSTFSIDFAALAYTNYETAQYEFKLDGIDTGFTTLTTNRKVFYTKLSPGTYTFLVRGSNSSGLWSSDYTKLVIQINPPFWRSLPAYLLYILIFVICVYYAFRYYEHKQLERNKRKSAILEVQKEREVYQARVESFTHLITIAQSEPDQALLKKLNDYILDNLSDTSMDVDQLAESLNMSRATFYRKVKAISNLTPNELINITRLKKAAELLVNSDLKIQQIANQTGFSSQAQFGRSFMRQFGMSPTEYAQNTATK